MSHRVTLSFPEAHRDSRSGTNCSRAIFACGFRPFFLGGALIAAVSIAAWLIVYFNGIAVGGPAGPIGWHAHEMVFGFTTAIIAGFLLTAVPKWTSTEALRGGRLLALFSLWFAGRLAMASVGLVPYAAAAAIDIVFLPALALSISLPIVGAKTVRNFGFIPLLFGLAAANGVFHLSHLGLIDGWAMRGLDIGLAIVVVIITIVGGRVIPFFTTNRLALPAIDRRRLVDNAALIATVIWLVAFGLAPTTVMAGLAAVAAGILNLLRMIGWHTSRTASVPLLWVLHAGYAFVGIGLLIIGLSGLEISATRSIGIHALTSGAIGILCLGMMARVSLGHTGRSLRAHGLTTLAFASICLAAITRTVLPWAIPSAYSASLIVSGLLWSVAWVLFLVVYVPILTQPRADGRPG